MSEEKIKLGQFFTKKEDWLQPQVRDFIVKSGCKIAYDPFAGAGDLLNVAKETLGLKEAIGYDIDPSLDWEINDSLKNIPHIDNAIIITNPPYLAKQSASRKNINLIDYFSNSTYTDIYLIALDKMLDAQKYVVAIIPESFINSSFKRKYLLDSITILETNPFLDTEAPVCVVCFDGKTKNLDGVKIYKNDEFVNDLKSISSIRIKPDRHVKIVFNDLDGWLGLRAVDSTSDNVRINFNFREKFRYDWEHRIKVSSRHMTLINMDIPEQDRQTFINIANSIVENIRRESGDVLLTPFKGNTKSGKRRRRLDYQLARAILEQAYDELYGGIKLV